MQAQVSNHKARSLRLLSTESTNNGSPKPIDVLLFPTYFVHTCRPKAIACIPKKDIQQCFVEEGALQYVDHPKRDLVGATDEEKAPGKNSTKKTLPRRTESVRQIRPKKTFVLSFFVNTYVGHYI